MAAQGLSAYNVEPTSCTASQRDPQVPVCLGSKDWGLGCRAINQNARPLCLLRWQISIATSGATKELCWILMEGSLHGMNSQNTESLGFRRRRDMQMDLHAA